MFVRAIAAALLASLLSAGGAAAQPVAPSPEPPQAEPDVPPAVDGPAHLHGPSTVTLDSGTRVRLPAGYFLPESYWDTLDLEVRRLQDTETRLTAENASLRSSESTWGWGTVGLVAGALAAGIVGGWWASGR